MTANGMISVLNIMKRVIVLVFQGLMIFLVSAMNDDIDDVDDIGSESSDLDDAIDVDCSENCGGSQNSGLLLSTILVIFLRIIHHFKISKNAATAILSFISFLLGKLSW